MIFFVGLLKLVRRRPLRFRRDISTIYVRITIDLYMSLTMIPEQLLYGRLRRINTIASLNNDDLPTHYRFETKEKLDQLLECSQFPQKMRSQHGHTFTGEEVLLVGLHRRCYH